jgi:Mn2+/Fe2+ NRAMP family transporter
MSNDVVAGGQLAVSRWKTFFAVLGPGLVVMLADSDVASIITAAQSGVQWGYSPCSCRPS